VLIGAVLLCFGAVNQARAQQPTLVCLSNSNPPPCTKVRTDGWPNYINEVKIRDGAGNNIAGSNENDDGSFTIFDVLGYFETWQIRITTTCPHYFCIFDLTRLYSGPPPVGWVDGGLGSGITAAWASQKSGKAVPTYGSGKQNACTCNAVNVGFKAPWISEPMWNEVCPPPALLYRKNDGENADLL
jgi:hypothetical protein